MTCPLSYGYNAFILLFGRASTPEQLIVRRTLHRHPTRIQRARRHVWVDLDRERPADGEGGGSVVVPKVGKDDGIVALGEDAGRDGVDVLGVSCGRGRGAAGPRGEERRSGKGGGGETEREGG